MLIIEASSKGRLPIVEFLLHNGSPVNEISKGVVT